MTLDKLTAPFERRRVIEYGRDGNKVVRHWYEAQHVAGSIYRSKDVLNDQGELEFTLFIFFRDASGGLRFERLSGPERCTVEQVADIMRRCRVDSVTHMYAGLNDCMEQDKFIGSAQIEFFRQFDSAAADCYARYQENFYARRDQRERARALARQAEEDARREKEQAELVAEKVQYFGWSDDVPSLRFDQVSTLMDTSVRVDGKMMTRREFVVNCIKDGWTPQKKEGVTSWYRRGSEVKESKPGTEYQLYKDEYVYETIKTKHDFAVFLSGRNITSKA